MPWLVLVAWGRLASLSVWNPKCLNSEQGRIKKTFAGNKCILDIMRSTFVCPCQVCRVKVSTAVPPNVPEFEDEEVVEKKARELAA